MESDKDTFHVVIKLPFPRPNDFAEPPSIVWTEEMEHQLWKHMSQKSKDWNAIAEQLGIPTQYVVRHAAFIYETQLRGIQQQLRLNVGRTKSPVVNKSRPPSIRYSDTAQYNELPALESRQTSDSVLLSKISAISPRLQEPANQDKSLIEEQPIESQEESEEDDQDTIDQLEKVQIEEEPAFLPRRSTSKTMSNSSRLSLSIQNLKKTITPQQQQQQQQQLPQSPQIASASSSNNPSALNSVGSSFSDLSDSSVTQSALEDAFMSKFNQGSKMSLLNFSRKYKE